MALRQELEQKTMDRYRNLHFKDHVATLEDHDGITVINWSEPGTCVYGVQYAFYRNYIFVTGDLGEAIFALTWAGNIHDFCKDIDIDYLHGKLACLRPFSEYDFSAAVAKESLDANFAASMSTREVQEIYKELLDAANRTHSREEWVDRLSRIDFYSVCPDAYEWIYGAGDVYGQRFLAYLVGLNMAAMRLSAAQKTPNASA